MQNSRSGFTVIELLIVIVIIGLLAGGIFLAYTGLQNRAENTKTLQGTKEFIKIMMAYKAQNNDLPNDSSSEYICLGEGYGIAGCVTNTYGNPVGVQSNPFNTEIKKVVKALPSLSTKLLTMDNGQKVAGTYFHYATKSVAYHLAGANQACSIGGVGGTYGNVTECVLTLN